METANAEVEQRWTRWLVERNRRGLRTCALLCVTLYPAFGIIDLLLAPRWVVGWLWATRAAVVLISVVVLRRLRSA